ncbi:MAG: 3-dehydroquinate synthase [Actinomycetales bacterium]|nr:3-dehydroquinate synthase [Actinomycetales bacterium]
MALRRLTVATQQPYEVVLGTGALAELPSMVAANVERIALIHAPHMSELAAQIAAQFPDKQVLTIAAPDGENAKTIGFVIDAWDQLGAAGFTRSDLVIGIGGGATTDVAGYIAASWLRGISFITVPTTILAMVDAAVGGKTGINVAAGKNLVGAFHEPAGVICELSILTSLPAREISGGLAEVVKCGFIADSTILNDIEDRTSEAMDPGSDLLADLIMRGIAVKAETVARDLKETGADGTIGREALNYGHTLGHAIERYEQYQNRHGEAIAVGMVFAAELGRRAGFVDADLVARHRATLSLVGLPIAWSDGSFDEMLAAMRLDKKSRGSQLRFVILDGLGKTRILAGPDEDSLRESFAAISGN